MDVVFSGRIFEILQQGTKLEIARRAPGIRLIIIKDNKMLITKEFRREINDYDYRLPGGKVFDTLKEYNLHSKDDILAFAVEAAKKECLEETGLKPNRLTHFQTTKAGATIEWDLFYFIVDDFEEEKQRLEEGEDIKVEWKTFKEVKLLLIENQIREDRTVGVLFRYLNGMSY